MSLDLPCPTLVCILTLEYPIWNIPNAKFSQARMELHKGRKALPQSHRKPSERPHSLFCCGMSHGRTGHGRLLTPQDLICLMSTTSAPSFPGKSHALIGHPPLTCGRCGLPPWGPRSIILTLLVVITETTQGSCLGDHSSQSSACWTCMGTGVLILDVCMKDCGLSL